VTIASIALDGTGEATLRSLFKVLKIRDRGPPMENEEIRFGCFRLDPRRPELRRDGQPVRTHRRALGILCALAEARGEIVSKDELMARLWPGRIVEEGNLHVHVVGKERQGAPLRLWEGMDDPVLLAVVNEVAAGEKWRVDPGSP
jgi:hypothetical protein